MAQRHEVERSRSEKLLLNILPQAIAEQLKLSETGIPDGFSNVTVLFAGLMGFTEMSARLPPSGLVGRLNVLFPAFDHLTEHYGLQKIKTVGDAYLIIGGLPTPRLDHANAVAEMRLDALQIVDQVGSQTGDPLRIRVDINTGTVLAG